MKRLAPALQAHLDSGATTLAWCWKILRSDDVIFGFTDHDRPLSFDGLTYEPESGFAAAEIRSGSDLSVDAQDAEGALTSDRITETDILDGRWDNALVEVWRVNWQDTGQRVLMRRGAIGELRRGRMSFVAEVRSLSHLLGQTVGRVFQGTCDAALGDQVAVAIPVVAPRDHAFIATGLSSFTAGWFAFGSLTWISGANAGRAAEISLHEVAGGNVSLTLLEAPVRGIAVADSFVVQAGCDKRLETCRAKFANAVNFRGFPHIPGQDTIMRYAKSGGRNDGGVL